MFAEDDLLPLSVLADMLFCERRAALHLIEGIWSDNIFTAEGTVLHSRVHDELPIESRGDVRIARGLPLRSLRLGLTGKADVVEFHRQDMPASEPLDLPAGKTATVALPGVKGQWRLFPVEYKRGRLRHEEGFEVQLCAQALCLEEMLGGMVAAGAIYYGKPHRRMEVVFSEALRDKTQRAAERLHALVRACRTPQAKYEKKCDSCSLVDVCLPKTIGESGNQVARYLADSLRA